MTPFEAIQKAIVLAGGQSKLAQAIGTRQSTISNWVTRNHQAGPKYCLLIEKAVKGKVKAHELRPDVFANNKKRITDQAVHK